MTTIIGGQEVDEIIRWVRIEFRQRPRIANGIITRLTDDYRARKLSQSPTRTLWRWAHRYALPMIQEELEDKYNPQHRASMEQGEV